VCGFAFTKLPRFFQKESEKGKPNIDEETEESIKKSCNLKQNYYTVNTSRQQYLQTTTKMKFIRRPLTDINGRDFMT
jgi:hypothetical protein